MTVKGIVSPGVGFGTVVDFTRDKLGASTVTDAVPVADLRAKPKVGPDDGAGASVVAGPAELSQYAPTVFVSVSPGPTELPVW